MALVKVRVLKTRLGGLPRLTLDDARVRYGLSKRQFDALRGVKSGHDKKGTTRSHALSVS